MNRIRIVYIVIVYHDINHGYLRLKMRNVQLHFTICYTIVEGLYYNK